MPFPNDCCDPETLCLMTQALDVAWEEVGFALVNEDVTPTALRQMMAVRIMAAVRDGERDPERLQRIGNRDGEPQ